MLKVRETKIKVGTTKLTEKKNTPGEGLYCNHLHVQRLCVGGSTKEHCTGAANQNFRSTEDYEWRHGGYMRFIHEARDDNQNYK